MENSDEDNFVWTDASNSASSDTYFNSSINNKMSKYQSGGDDSEYDKNYKKKLHKQLFSNEKAPDPEKDPKDEKIKHKKKRKLEKDTSESENSEIPRKKKIKVEPESDVDSLRGKHKTHVSNGHDDIYDEQFLEGKVKKEESFLFFPERDKKKRNKSTCNINESEVSDTDKNKIARGLSTAEETYHEPLEHEYMSYKKKKKKKKSEKRDDSPIQREENSEVDYTMDKHTMEHEYSVGTINTNNNSFQDLTIDNTNVDVDISEISKISKGNITYNDSYDQTSSAHTEHSKRKFSEKLQFEDDLSDPMDTSQTNITLNNTSRATELTNKLKNFVKNNTKLKSCNMQNAINFSIQDQDEVWIIKCPSDVEVTSFLDKNLHVDNKCKIKLSGQTYEGIVDSHSEHTSIILIEYGKLKVKNVLIDGHVNLHKRIPKVHMQDDAMVVNNQTNFIPLPETKCRHPLLGSHYKKAIKLPSSIAERLRTIDNTPNKMNKKSNEINEENIHSPKSEQSSYKLPGNDNNTSIKKKKKKRKHSDRDIESTISPPAPSHKTKRKKYNLDAAETWESEQAIEQSLFDY